LRGILTNHCGLGEITIEQSISKSTSDESNTPALLPREFIFPFCLVTTLFALWGFANDVTNPLVTAFKDVFVISNVQSSLVQTAFYGGYATMALPAAIFIRRFSYKAGIIVGLSLYATGALLSIPAVSLASFNLFLVALYVLTFGLAFLETTANPYILSMGPAETATRRLNLAQAFNPIGSLSGMVVASLIILSNLQVSDFREEVKLYQNALNASPPIVQAKIDPELLNYLEETQTKALANGETSLADLPYNNLLEQSLADFKAGQFATFHGQSFEQMQAQDLGVVKLPYVVIAMIVIAVMLVFIFSKLPNTGHDSKESMKLSETLRRLAKNKGYTEGVLAQTLYVGAQIMCWTFIIHYATTNLGMSTAEAQNYNIVAMVIFCFNRFICTFVLKYIRPGKLLLLLAAGGIAMSFGTIFLSGMSGLYALIGISACMSLMFPTIYGIALFGMGEEAKVASAGLIFAIVGGALMPPLQGLIIDMGGNTGVLMGLPAVNVSFALPLICFVYIAFYGWRSLTVHEKRGFHEAV